MLDNNIRLKRYKCVKDSEKDIIYLDMYRIHPNLKNKKIKRQI